METTMAKSNAFWAIGAVAATAVAVVGGVTYANAKVSSLKKVWDNISVYGDVEATLSAEVLEVDHIPLCEGEAPAPDTLHLKAEIGDDGKGELCVTARLNGVIATAACQSPEWRRNKAVVVRLLAAGIFSKITDLSGDDPVVRMDKKVLKAIRNSLETLLS